MSKTADGNSKKRTSRSRAKKVDDNNDKQDWSTWVASCIPESPIMDNADDEDALPLPALANSFETAEAFLDSIASLFSHELKSFMKPLQGTEDGLMSQRQWDRLTSPPSAAPSSASSLPVSVPTRQTRVISPTEESQLQQGSRKQIRPSRTLRKSSQNNMSSSDSESSESDGSESSSDDLLFSFSLPSSDKAKRNQKQAQKPQISAPPPSSSSLTPLATHALKPVSKTASTTVFQSSGSAPSSGLGSIKLHRAIRVAPANPSALSLAISSESEQEGANQAEEDGDEDEHELRIDEDMEMSKPVIEPINNDFEMVIDEGLGEPEQIVKPAEELPRAPSPSSFLLPPLPSLPSAPSISTKARQTLLSVASGFSSLSEEEQQNVSVSPSSASSSSSSPPPPVDDIPAPKPPPPTARRSSRLGISMDALASVSALLPADASPSAVQQQQQSQVSSSYKTPPSSSSSSKNFTPGLQFVPGTRIPLRYSVRMTDADMNEFHQLQSNTKRTTKQQEKFLALRQRIIDDKTDFQALIHSNQRVFTQMPSAVTSTMEQWIMYKRAAAVQTLPRYTSLVSTWDILPVISSAAAASPLPQLLFSTILVSNGTPSPLIIAPPGSEIPIDPSCIQTSDAQKNMKTRKLCPLSEDEIAKRLAAEHGIDFALSASSLSAIWDLRTLFDIPVVMEESSSPAAKKTIFLDKPLLPRTLSSRDTCTRFFKHAWRSTAAPPESQKVEEQEGMDAEQEARMSVVNYALWTLEGFKLLIRYKTHAVLPSPSPQPVLMHCRMEYLPQLGQEYPSTSECARIWIQSYMRQGCSVAIGRFHTVAESALLLANDVMPFASLPPSHPSAVVALHFLLDKLHHQLQPQPAGRYLLSSNPSASSCPISLQRFLSAEEDTPLHRSRCNARDFHTEVQRFGIANDKAQFPEFGLLRQNQIPGSFPPKPMHFSPATALAVSPFFMHASSSSSFSSLQEQQQAEAGDYVPPPLNLPGVSTLQLPSRSYKRKN